MDSTTANSNQDNAPQRPAMTLMKIQQQQIPARSFFSIEVDLLIIFVLGFVALIPRILLAMKLDMVTDEVVYILGGKIYFPLLIHLNIHANGWNYNYEHPPFAKLLIGLALKVNTTIGHPLGDLFTARLASILCAIYWFGRAPFGHIVALVAALCLAVSPWFVYFSALAYLDMTMTACITLAYLLLWHAIRHPWLYLLSGILVGIGADSKYTAVLAIPGMVLFTLYYFLALRPYIPKPERPRIPWFWWLGTIILAPVTFYISDPGIWQDPITLLQHSFDFEWNHSQHGHLTFIAGQYGLHVPQWAILYIIIAKISAFVTIPAAFFVLFALIQLVRFHLRTPGIHISEATSVSFVLIWLLALLSMFSLLNIVVGTHYHLPIAPPVAVAGTLGLATLLRYRRGQLFVFVKRLATSTELPHAEAIKARISTRSIIIVALLVTLIVGPHLVGLTTVYAAEGYTSEFFQSENNVLQVAYPGYREAVQWLANHTHQPARIGLVALKLTISAGGNGVSWYSYNSDLPKRFELIEANPTDYQFYFDYLIWPMHLVQRGYIIPNQWSAHIVHIIMGGHTIYCFIMARNGNTISQ
jgi:hypothetical protein